jgi:hypothetical protein
MVNQDSQRSITPDPTYGLDVHKELEGWHCQRESCKQFYQIARMTRMIILFLGFAFIVVFIMLLILVNMSKQ